MKKNKNCLSLSGVAAYLGMSKAHVFQLGEKELGSNKTPAGILERFMRIAINTHDHKNKARR